MRRLLSWSLSSLLRRHLNVHVVHLELSLVPAAAEMFEHEVGGHEVDIAKAAVALGKLGQGKKLC